MAQNMAASANNLQECSNKNELFLVSLQVVDAKLTEYMGNYM